MTSLKWFYSFLKPYKKRMLLGLVLVTIVAALALVNPYISGMLVDDVIIGNNKDILGILILCLILTTLCRSAVRLSYLSIFEKVSQNVLFNMRSHVYRRLMQQDFSFYNKNRTGDLMSRQTGDMDAIRHFVSYVIYCTYENTLMFVFALIMVFSVNVKLACCMILILPFTALNTYCQSKSVKPAFDNIRQRFSSLNSFAQENISGNRVIKAFAKEDFEIEKFQKENGGYKEAELAAARIWVKYIPVFEFLSSILVIILMLVGGYMVIQGEMTMGAWVTVNGYLWMLNNPLRVFGWLINDYQRFRTSAEKIYYTVSQEPNLKMLSKPYTKEKFNGDVEFRNVSYKADDEDIINDVSFKVKSGQTVGIIGATGSGKSTIMNLVCRFFDATDGAVLIDRVNVKNLELHNLRDNIGIAMQDVFLFSDTIEGNIAYGKPDCTLEDVVRVAKIANADGFIREMPEGYDTIVGERGMGLSGGQKQRISLARALLKNPSIIILDDTTSAVDMDTETKIQNALDSNEDNTTVFIIAHRISSIKDADLILVLDHGVILEQGTHESLLEKQGYYAAVFNHQYGEFDKFKREGVF